VGKTPSHSCEQSDANTGVTITDADESHRSSGKQELHSVMRKTTNERRESRRDLGYKYVRLPHPVSWAVGIPKLT